MQDGRLIQRFFHRRIAVAEPVLHQMNPQHRHQRIGRAAASGLNQGIKPFQAATDPSRSGATPYEFVCAVQRTRRRQTSSVSSSKARRSVVGGRWSVVGDFAKSGSLSQRFTQENKVLVDALVLERGVDASLDRGDVNESMCAGAGGLCVVRAVQ